MENTSGSGGWERPRGTSATSSDDDSSGEIEYEPGGLGPTNAGSATNMGSLDDHDHSKGIPDGVVKSSRDVEYGCGPGRQQMALDRVADLPQSDSNVVTTAGLEIDTPAEESNGFSPELPITKISLSELDIIRIVYNLKLRHDINFDPHLHFRPNLDGENGRRKAQKADDFWNGLQVQMEGFMADPAAFESKLGGKEWSLQSTLRAIGEILGTLVPPEDRSAVEEILNVDLLMHEFRKGVADLEKLGLWLARTLKSHCAPMRDEWVDEMTAQLSVGYRERDVALLVRGLQSLFGVLEAMKLDIANHQIRCLRPLLIQDTVEFEQSFYLKKIALCKIDIRGAHAWFQAAKSSSPHDELHTTFIQSDMWAFFKGFADLLLPSKMGTVIPDTFMFDEERIEKLRSDISDAINLDVCVHLQQNLHSQNYSQETQFTTCIPAPPGSPLRPKFPAQISGVKNSALKPSDMATGPKFPREVRVSPFPRVTRRLQKQATLDESFRAIELESEDDDSDTESPPSTRRTSFSSVTSSHLSRSMELPKATVDAQLGRAILAIVNEPSGNNRWQQSSPEIALELLRPNPNHGDLSKLESELTLHLCNPTSSVFLKSESRILAELYPLLSELAARYAPLTATQLFEASTTSRPLPYHSQVPQHALSEPAKQMAHIGMLHWRVWAELAYVFDPDHAGHVTDATDPESRTEGKAWEALEESDRRPTLERQNSFSESIQAGS